MQDLGGEGSRAPLLAVRAPPGPGSPSAALPWLGGAVARGRRQSLAGTRESCASCLQRRAARPRPCLTRRGCRTWPSMCSACYWVRCASSPRGVCARARGGLHLWVWACVLWEGTPGEPRTGVGVWVCLTRTPLPSETRAASAARGPRFAACTQASAWPLPLPVCCPRVR